MAYQYETDIDSDAEQESDFFPDKSFNLKGGSGAEKISEDFVPTHNIIIDFCLRGEQKNEKVTVDGRVYYSANLKGVVPNNNHSMVKLVPSLDDESDDFYEDEADDLESQATVVAYLDDLQIRKIESGKNSWKLNDCSVLRVVKDEDCLMMDFSDLFNEGQIPDTLRKFVPSDEKMFDNLSMDLDSLEDELEFEWNEEEKGIKIIGWVKIEEL
ncbi:MAG TPA: hypothetical protein PL066_01575 [bacterium]|nr:hypothetical protein [bacterium]